MGYYTQFDIVATGVDLEELASAVNDVSHYSAYVLDNRSVYVSDAKWYEHEAHLSAVSERFPGVLVEVEGVGEEYPDIWRQRFLDGRKSQKVKAEVRFPGLVDP